MDRVFGNDCIRCDKSEKKKGEKSGKRPGQFAGKHRDLRKERTNYLQVKKFDFSIQKMSNLQKDLANLQGSTMTGHSLRQMRPHVLPRYPCTYVTSSYTYVTSSYTYVIVCGKCGRTCCRDTPVKKNLLYNIIYSYSVYMWP